MAVAGSLLPAITWGMTAKADIRVARVYDEPRPEDGDRILVDRVWPRGFRKDDPRVGHWFKDAAPSRELRGWYDHRPERFDEFVTRYEDELRTPQGAAAFDGLRELTRGKKTVTLVTATRDLDGSQAAVLARLLGRH
ncbi:hypothetical protein MTER_12740 [Mycolicibacter terrae]|uniref:DUF488 family protein n=2 Tax=Mycolicibacter terrae TaxID=1788 RepID=A0AAD1HUU0_9MYCO|nr:hypothetical protein MTER_12740 [Mycolicibacter terrae]SNV83467.1 Conserved protein of uncharacterised function (part2) [Mycolicibacter terrae]